MSNYFDFDSLTSLTMMSSGILLAYLLDLHSKTSEPKLFYKESNLNLEIISNCKMLSQRYIPTFLWGKSGHVQTFIYGKIGRINSPFPKGERHYHVMDDGATMTFDIFLPTSKENKNCVLVVCPGIANSSESLYIRTFIDFAQRNGFSLAVLNHFGVVSSVQLTAPRLYTYGDTEEYGMMVRDVVLMFPGFRLVAVGFSMGANVVIKYLGEGGKPIQSLFTGALSFCQGYDIIKIYPLLKEWRKLRRLYVWAMTKHQQKIIKRHQEVLFHPAFLDKVHLSLDLPALMRATSLHQIDELYSHKRAGFSSCLDYYNWASSSNYIDKIHIPMLLLNAEDDPIVPSEVFHIPKSIALTHDNVIFIVTKHGGHLGFYEGGVIIPNTVTWLDRLIVSYTNSLLAAVNKLNNIDYYYKKDFYFYLSNNYNDNDNNSNNNNNILINNLNINNFNIDITDEKEEEGKEEEEEDDDYDGDDRGQSQGHSVDLPSFNFKYNNLLF